MGVMDTIFGIKPQPTQASASVNPVHVIANPTVPNANTPVSDGSVPGLPDQTKSVSPLDGFKTLFDPPAKDKPEGIPSAVPNFNLDPATAKIDFTAGIPAEKLAAAFPGSDPKAVQEILQAIGRTSFEQNFTIGAKTMEGAITRQTENLTTKTLPELLRREDASQLAKASSELFTHPATATIMTTLQTQFANKFPAATPEQIKQYTIDHFNAMMGVHAKEQGLQVVKAPPVAKDTDWNDWVGLDNM